MVRGGVSQDLLHQERILRHSLHRFEKVEGERHPLNLPVSLALSQQAVELRPRLHQLLQQRGSRHLGGTKPDVGSHGGELKTDLRLAPKVTMRLRFYVFTENISNSRLVPLHCLPDPQGLQQFGVGDYQVLPVYEQN